MAQWLTINMVPFGMVHWPTVSTSSRVPMGILGLVLDHQDFNGPEAKQLSKTKKVEQNHQF